MSQRRGNAADAGALERVDLCIRRAQAPVRQPSRDEFRAVWQTTRHRRCRLTRAESPIRAHPRHRFRHARRSGEAAGDMDRPAAFRVLGSVEFRKRPPARVVDPIRCPATSRKPRRERYWSGRMAYASAIPARAGGLRCSAGRMGSSSRQRRARPHDHNIMEMTAALEGLRALPCGSRACVVTDSRYLHDGMTSWMAGWRRKGWKTASGNRSRTRRFGWSSPCGVRHEQVGWPVKGHMATRSTSQPTLTVPRVPLLGPRSEIRAQANLGGNCQAVVRHHTCAAAELDRDRRRARPGATSAAEGPPESGP